MAIDYTKYKTGSLCGECTLRSQPGPVPGKGSRQDAKLIYIAQNPGQHEVGNCPCRSQHPTMEPLVGPSGNIFNRQLAEVGIPRKELYVTNIVKCTTPDNRPPTDHEIRCCQPIINAELERATSDTVLLAGAVPFKTLVGDFSSIHPGYHPSDNIMVRMGCVEQLGGRKWMGTIHPAFIMRMPEWREAGLDHLRKAWSIVGRVIPLPQVELAVNDERVTQYGKLARERKVFADDVENVLSLGTEEDDYIGGEWPVTMCGFSAEPYHAIVCRPDQLHLWKETWADANTTQFEHNGEHERYHLEKVAPQNNRRFDTMLATHYLRSYAPKKLKPFVVSTYTLLPYFNRDLGKLDERLYNGMDNISTLLAGQEMWKQLRAWKLEEIFFQLGMPLLPILEEWRRQGVKIDVRRAFMQKKFLGTRIAEAQSMIAKLCGPTFNYNSPMQVKELLYKTYGLPVQYSGHGNKARDPKERKVTTDNEARKHLRQWIGKLSPEQQERYKKAKIFLDLQDYITGEETKLEFLSRISPDMKIHAYFKSHGTSSFRLASKPNMQNWPVYDVVAWGGARRDDNRDQEDPTGTIKMEGLGSLRSNIIPDNPEGWLLSTDFEQIEIWAYAQQTQCKWLLNMYHSGEYIYGKVYEEFYQLPFFQEGKPRKKKFKLPSISEKYLRRAKAIPLGFLYGRSAAAVAEEHGWTEGEAGAYRKHWFRLCPELEDQYSRDRYQMEQKGYIRYNCGHIIHFPNRKPSEVYAMRGQHPAACVLLQSIKQINEGFERSGLHRQGVRAMLSVHDSITFSFPSNLLVVEGYERVIKPILERPIPELGGFVFRHSAEVGKRWDWENEEYDKWKATNCS